MPQQHPPGSTIERAWSRIVRAAESRIVRAAESQLAWFVKLAKATSFDTMTEGEQLLWKEEYVAMLLKGTQSVFDAPPDTKRYPRSAPSPEPTSFDQVAYLIPTLSQIQDTRNTIAVHLERLADGHSTYIGPFAVSFGVDFIHIHDGYGKTTTPRYIIERGEMGLNKGDPIQSALLRHLAKLLSFSAHPVSGTALVDQIRRCPYPKCRKIFLQSRLNQEYCDRKCQSVDVMRKRRDKAKMAVKAKKQGAKPTAKGGSRHGKAKW